MRVVLLAGVLVCVGCVSLTSFQSPVSLSPGSTSVGGGLAVNYWASDGLPLPEADFLVRYGVFKGVDVGGKVSLPFASVSADVKWQFLNGPLLAALDVGGSYGHSPFLNDVIDEAVYLSAYPALLVGSDRVYVAARPLMVHTDERRLAHGVPVSSYTDWYPQVIVGGSFGDRLRVMPELSFAFGMGNRQNPSILPGIGIAIRYGPDAPAEESPFW